MHDSRKKVSVTTYKDKTQNRRYIMKLTKCDALKELATGEITPEEAAGQVERVSKETIR